MNQKPDQNIIRAKPHHKEDASNREESKQDSGDTEGQPKSQAMGLEAVINKGNR